MSRYQRDKGKRGEREIAQILRVHGYDVRRGWQSRAGTDEPDIVGVDGWHPEVGIGNINPRRKWEQARADAAAGTRPVAITRRDGGDWLVTVAVCDWLRLLRLAKQAGREGT